jgi:hypothetical protein
MVAGKVSTHAVAICHRVPFWMPPPDPTMVPAIPPVTTCVVLTGNPVKPAPPIRMAFHCHKNFIWSLDCEEPLSLEVENQNNLCELEGQFSAGLNCCASQIVHRSLPSLAFSDQSCPGRQADGWT